MFAIIFGIYGPVDKMYSMALNKIKAFDSLDEIEEMRPQILQKYVLPHVVSYKKQDLSKYDVITHIRGGDNHVKNGSQEKRCCWRICSLLLVILKIIKDNGYKKHADGVGR